MDLEALPMPSICANSSALRGVNPDDMEDASDADLGEPCSLLFGEVESG